MIHQYPCSHLAVASKDKAPDDICALFTSQLYTDPTLLGGMQRVSQIVDQYKISVPADPIHQATIMD